MLDTATLRLPVLGVYTKDDITEIFKKVTEFNQKAIEHEIQYYKKIQGDNYNNDLENEIKENLKVKIGVYWDKGSRISEDIADVYFTLTPKVNKIVIENHSKYDFVAKKLPLSSIRVELDLTRIDILDATDPLFKSSCHNSNVEIMTEDKEYAEVFSKSLNSKLKNINILVKLLHSRLAYLLLLFMLIYPLYMWQALNFEKTLAEEVFKDYSAGFSVFFYVFVFLLIANVFRFIFNLSRYLVPTCRYAEKNSFQDKLYTSARFVVIATMNGIYATFIGGIFLKYITKLML